MTSQSKHATLSRAISLPWPFPLRRQGRSLRRRPQWTNALPLSRVPRCFGLQNKLLAQVANPPEHGSQCNGYSNAGFTSPLND